MLDGLYKERSYASAVDVVKSGLPKRAAAQIFGCTATIFVTNHNTETRPHSTRTPSAPSRPPTSSKRFLNARRFEELAAYLLKAHGKDETKRQFVLDDPYGFPRPLEELDELKTRPELTTSLINCYAKLKDVSALDRFVRNEDDLAVDGATAVVALRDAGYYAHAERAAERTGVRMELRPGVGTGPLAAGRGVGVFRSHGRPLALQMCEKIRYTTREGLSRSDDGVTDEPGHGARCK